MIVKVCGVVDIDQFEWLEQQNIDMIGLNFYKQSARFINDNSLVEKSFKVKKVGVFVNATFEEVKARCNEFNLDMVQLHGNEGAELSNRIAMEIPVIKAFGIDPNFNFNDLEPYLDSTTYFLFDTKSSGYGGSGRKFNWDKLSEYKFNKPFILSGGISLDDIPEIWNLKFDALAGIDVNSGFEQKPGVKDLGKIDIMMKLINNEKS